MVDKRLLQRREGFRGPQALDRHDLVAVVHAGEGEAGVDPSTVQKDGAGAALAMVAALLGAGETEMMAEGVEEGGSHVSVEHAELSVDVQRRLHG